MNDAFRWNEWNLQHIANHAVSPQEAEEVVDGAFRPFPQEIGDEKWLVRGQTSSGRYLQIIFLIEDDGYYVIPGRGLTDKEKRQLRRRRR